MRQLLSRLSLCLLYLVACNENDPEPSTVYQVPASVEVYVQRFIEEGRLRGHTITIDNLIVEFSNITEEDICGQCHLTPKNPKRQRRITLDTSFDCWKDAPDEAREELVFHELGHCVLNRLKHREDLLPNGNFASIMNGKYIGLYRSCKYNYDIGGTIGNCNMNYKRSYYLDELFDESTPAPAWESRSSLPNFSSTTLPSLLTNNCEYN